MVPASTLMYGSIFWRVTRKPRASSREPIDAAASPLPSEDTTPPVTKMYLVVTASLSFCCARPAPPASACAHWSPSSRHAATNARSCSLVLIARRGGAGAVRPGTRPPRGRGARRAHDLVPGEERPHAPAAASRTTRPAGAREDRRGARRRPAPRRAAGGAGRRSRSAARIARARAAAPGARLRTRRGAAGSARRSCRAARGIAARRRAADRRGARAAPTSPGSRPRPARRAQSDSRRPSRSRRSGVAAATNPLPQMASALQRTRSASPFHPVGSAASSAISARSR